MGIINNFLNKLKTKKYEKMKEEYLKSFLENGQLGDINNLREYIKQKKILLLSSDEKYGDEFDEIEEIFSDNIDIINEIKTLREKKLIEECRDLKDEYSLEETTFQEIENKAFRYEQHYNKRKKATFLESEKGIELKKAKRFYEIIKRIDIDLDNSNFYTNMYNLITKYAVSQINGADDMVSKQYILHLAEEVVSEVSCQLPSNKKVEKNIILEKLKSEPTNADSTKKFLKKIEQVNSLRKHGIKIDITDENISFIDVNEQYEEFSEDLKTKKEEAVYEKREFSVDDFAMVRTTQYFPENGEMETIDELNSAVPIDNFLTDYLVEKTMKEEFGEDYSKKSYESEEIYNRKSELYNKYSILSHVCRSTKHFTLNGLVSSHEYGNFEKRPFIIIDPLAEHINKKSLIRLDESDTYFKVSRDEPFKLSPKAEMMMPLEEYLKRQDDTEFQKQISRYKLTIFSGDETKAVEIKLGQMGYFPEGIGKWGFALGEKFPELLDKSIIKIGEENGKSRIVHFYSEEKRADAEKTYEMQKDSHNEFVEFLFKKLAIQEKYKKKALNFYVRPLEDEELEDIVNTAGKDKIIGIIEEYNRIFREKVNRNKTSLKREM